MIFNPSPDAHGRGGADALLRRLVDFPYVLVRLRCDLSKRAGAYRLVALPRIGQDFSDQAMTPAAINRLTHLATILKMNVGSYRWKAALKRKRGPP